MRDFTGPSMTSRFTAVRLWRERDSGLHNIVVADVAVEKVIVFVELLMRCKAISHRYAVSSVVRTCYCVSERAKELLLGCEVLQRLCIRPQN